MTTYLDGQIAELEEIVEESISRCQKTWYGMRCTLPEDHDSIVPHSFPIEKPAEFQAIVVLAFSLPAEFREVFLLCDIQGFTIAEAATILGLSESIVAALLDHARKQLNQRLRATC